MGFLVRTLVTAVALWIATIIVPGIGLTGRDAWLNWLTLLAVAVVFGVVNAVIKPIIKIFGCLLYLLTLGLISFVVNALLFLLVSWVCTRLALPFHVDGFWAAFWGAIVVGVVGWAISLIVPDGRPTRTR